jgi:hypothetical protein
MSRGPVVLFALSGVLAACGRPPAALRDVQDAAGDVASGPLDAPEGSDTVEVHDALAADAPLAVPDLQFVSDEMGSTFFDQHTFRADDCEVVEGCVAAAGERELLRFRTVTTDTGSADLVVGMTPPPGESNDVFEWSPCHMHHHFRNYTSYELVNSTGVVVTGRKQSFCLSDNEQVQPGFPSNAYSCTNQGISRGWADVYDSDLPCQWIDITGVPSGTYTLRIILNPLHRIVESDYTNNVFSVDVQF